MPSSAAMTQHQAFPYEVEIIAIHQGAKNIKLFELRRPGASNLPESTAGSHIDVHLPNGMMRQYSLIVPKTHPQYFLIAVKKDANGRGGSRFMHENLTVGDRLKIAGPRNNFQLVQGHEHSVLIAGGIGITPIWSMAQQLLSSGASWELHYACRTREEVIFEKEIVALRQVRVYLTGEGDGKLDVHGIINGAPPDAKFYCCGPSSMIRSYRDATVGLTAENVHFELFSASNEASREGGYSVVLNRSGRTVHVSSGQTLLECLLEKGIDTSYSCSEGICGACETSVIEGIPDHRDNVLTDTQRRSNKTMMLCCSGSLSNRLVLDL